MNNNIDTIYSALSYVDDAFVDEAAHITAPHRSARRLWVRYCIGAAACLALVVTVGAYMALNAEPLYLSAGPESTAHISETQNALDSTESDTDTDTDPNTNDRLFFQTESNEIIVYNHSNNNGNDSSRNNDAELIEFTPELLPVVISDPIPGALLVPAIASYEAMERIVMDPGTDEVTCKYTEFDEYYLEPGLNKEYREAILEDLLNEEALYHVQILILEPTDRLYDYGVVEKPITSDWRYEGRTFQEWYEDFGNEKRFEALKNYYSEFMPEVTSTEVIRLRELGYTVWMSCYPGKISINDIDEVSSDEELEFYDSSVFVYYINGVLSREQIKNFPISQDPELTYRIALL